MLSVERVFVDQLQLLLEKFLWPKVELDCVVWCLIAKIQFFTVNNIIFKNSKFNFFAAEIRVLLSKEVQKKLDERIVEENLGMASLTNLERFSFKFFIQLNFWFLKL